MNIESQSECATSTSVAQVTGSLVGIDNQGHVGTSVRISSATRYQDPPGFRRYNRSSYIEVLREETYTKFDNKICAE